MLEAEFVDELRNKRFGLSDTVYTQIKRYSEAVRKNQRTAQDEAVALARLIGRRPDAEAVLRAAGRYLAHEAYHTMPAVTRTLVRVLPSFIARPMALRHVRRMAAALSERATCAASGHTCCSRCRARSRWASAPGSTGCTFYEATLRELMRLLVGATGAVEHTRCAGRGEGACEWRADWRGPSTA